VEEVLREREITEQKRPKDKNKIETILFSHFLIVYPQARPPFEKQHSD
jgi:hypothetical protein